MRTLNGRRPPVKTETDTSADASPARRAGRREWIGLAVLALPTLLISLDMSVLYLALPLLSADLGADAAEQLWIMDVYGFMIAGFLVTMGTLGDRIGRRRLLMYGAAAFGAASVLAAYSTSAGMLIGTRAVLGVAGATLMPSTLALIGNMFRDARQRGLAIAVWISCFMGGAAIGPVVGGALLETFWWGAAFLLGVPVMVVLLVTGPMLLPEFRTPGAGRIDLVSVGLSLAAILPVVYGLKQLAKDGWSGVPVAAVVAGAVFGFVFVRRQRSLPNPLLDLTMMADRTFRSALGVWLLFGAIQGGSFLFITLYLQMVAGLTPMEAGLWLVPGALAMITGSQLGPVLARRARPGSVIAAGLGVAATGYVLLTTIDGGGALTTLVTGIVIINFGSGLAAALGTDLIVGSVRPERAGAASALSETGAELGIALGVATLGSLTTALYRGGLEDALPDNLPAGAAEAAREGLAGAVGAAGRLPAPLGGDLLTAAREAFASGLATLMGISALLFVVLAVLAAVTLRQAPPLGGSDGGEQESSEDAAGGLTAAAHETAMDETALDETAMAGASVDGASVDGARGRAAGPATAKGPEGRPETGDLERRPLTKVAG
ncbi:MFS transporter [Spirillospora sp. CA-255316]